MGLAGEKKRMKLSHDPNNTKWTNDSTSFGLKMMTAQGWTPGQYLGAKDAAHAEFHTAANASHIRVAIKDDNLGLGAKIGTGVGHGECTGLDAFKNLLGRLNGKEEAEIEMEQRSRDDLRRAIYSERKWGTQRFVSGGFLIGDKIQILIDAEAERIRKLLLGSERSSGGSDSSEESAAEVEVVPVEKTKKSRKRKAEALDESKPEVFAVKVKKSKKKRRVEEAVKQESAPFEGDKASKKSKKSNEERNSKPKTQETEEDPEEKSESDSKRRKMENKEKKERKRKEKVGSDDVEVEIEETEKEKRKREKKAKKEKKKAAGEDNPEEAGSLVPATKESTPAVATSRAATMMQGRHAVRSRYIAQKRLASMDAASLAQIFMIKSQ